MKHKKLWALLCACLLALSPAFALEMPDAACATVDALQEGLCSWDQGGTDASTPEGDDYTLTAEVYIANGSYDAEHSAAGEQEAITDTELSHLDITSAVRGTNGIVIYNTDYRITDTTVQMNASEEDGTTSSDFSGKGAALAVYGKCDVTVSDSVLKACGVGNLSMFVDNGASVLLKNSVLFSAGGTLYEGYVNSPKTSMMVAPPWILGIMGNSRTTNLMGTDSTFTVVDCETAASNWAVLSTDAGTNMTLNVVNSSLALTGSDVPLQADGLYDTENPYTTRNGYGTYVIGGAKETFLGVTMDVGTYASIFTGGSAYFGNLVRGESYELLKADGSVHTVYEAGEDVKTVINSDTFGFMSHQNTNTIELDGIQVNSGFTSFVIKSGNDTDILVENGTELNAENGILLQLFDNDDATTAFDSSTMAFGMTHEEYAGFPTEAVQDSSTAGQGGMDPNAGQMPEGNMVGSAPQMPEGNMGGSAGQMPEGVMDGSAGQMPEGVMGGSAGQMPEGGMDGNAPQMPEGGMDGNVPQMPEGNMGGSAPEKPDGGAAMEPMSAGETASAFNTATFTVKDAVLTGDLYNGIGWNANALSSGNVKRMVLNVNLGGGSVLSGAIASTSCIHATYEGQMELKNRGITAFDDDAEAAAFASAYQTTCFTQSEYFNICQVANLVKSNGLNSIYVSLTDDAVWNVTGTSLIDTLSIEGEATVVVGEGVTLTVGGETYSCGTYTAKDF